MLDHNSFLALQQFVEWQVFHVSVLNLHSILSFPLCLSASMNLCLNVKLFFFCNRCNSFSLIDLVPMVLCYPPFDQLNHELIVYNMGCSVNPPIQPFQFCLCFHKQQRIGGLEFMNIAKYFDDVYSCHMLIN